MEIRRLDATPYLAEGEIVQYKTSAKQSRFKVIQLVLCWLIALVAVAGDCFLLSMTYALNEQLTNVNTFLMPLEICLIVVHLIPFGFWVGNVFASSKDKGGKWYAITNRRIIIVQGNKPVNVTYVNISEISSFRVGRSSLMLLLGEELFTLSGIANPQEMGDKLMEIFGDAKVDEGEKPTAKAHAVEAVEEPAVEEPAGEPEVVIAEVCVKAEEESN